MKRSYFKQKPRKPMKRSKLKKVSKQKISTIQNKIWEHCKRIIRKMYGNVCYTCGATNLVGSNWQTGHLWAKASLGAFLKYDLRVLRPQCSRCNLFLGGMGAEFYRRMFVLEGKAYMEKLVADRQKSVKTYDHYLKTLQDYKLLYQKIGKTLNNHGTQKYRRIRK